MSKMLRNALDFVRARTLRLGRSADAACGDRRSDMLLGVLVLALLSYSWMFSEISVPNERSRVYLAVAMVDHGTLSIDEPVRRYGEIYDRARRDGRYYTDKAPGSSLLAAVPYWVARRFTEPSDWRIHELVNLMRTWVMLPVSLIGFLWLRRFLRRLRLGPPAIDVASLGWILGTSAFHYGSAFYGHQLVAVCLLGALALAHDAERAQEESGRGRAVHLSMLGAGMLAGFAGLTEYQAGIPAAMLALYVVAGPVRKRPLALVTFISGALPFALLLFGYNTLAFGGPLKLSYQFLIDPSLRELHGQGIGGVAAPHWDYAVGGLFSLHRGFFATSPLLLLALPGLAVLWRRGARRLSVLVGAALIYFLLFISSTKIWYAGWGFGPRLLVPVMAWTAVPVAACIDAMERWPIASGFARGLALFGILIHQAVHAVFPELPEGATNPLIDAVIPALRGDHVSPNLVSRAFGVQGPKSLLPLAVLVLIAACAVVLRGGRETRRAQRAWWAGAAIATALLCAVPSMSAKPGWAAHEVKRFTQWMAQLEATEERLRRP